MTLLVASIAPETATQLEDFAQRARDEGADAIEIRLDSYRDPSDFVATFLRKNTNVRWIVTCRSVAEGGLSKASAGDRARLLCAVADGTNAYLDFEFADWTHDDTARDALSRVVRADGPRLILSAHDFDGTTLDESRLAAQLEAVDSAAPGAIAKLAHRASSITAIFAALDLSHKHGPRAIAIAMGEDGLWTRVLAKKLGAFASYCALDKDATTAPGQITLAEMRGLYRWSTIGSNTQVFGVIGDPVAHSMSPLIFNHWFANAKINAVYLPLRTRGGDEGLKSFLDGCCDRPWLHVGGFSVTIPHKSGTVTWLGDRADQMSRSIGAANTLVFRNGKVTGYNTDAYAATTAMVRAMGCSQSDLAGMRVDLLGAGGAAKALLYALHELGCVVTVYGRSEEKTRTVANEYGAQAADWNSRERRSGEIVINCTSVGMWPDTGASPLPADAMNGCRLAFDLIYNPLRTQMLANAEAQGIKTLNGLDMFLRQAAMQFELWTGQLPDVDSAPRLIERRINTSTNERP